MKFVSFRTLRSMCIDLIIFLVPVSIVVFSLPYILNLLMPFIAGLFLYFLANPLNKFLLRQKLPPTVAAFLSLGIISAIVFFLLRYIGGKIFEELISFTQNPPQFYYSAVNSATQTLTDLMNRTHITDISFSDSVIPGLSDALSGQVAKLIANISEFVINFAKSIPAFLIASFAAVFTTFFLLKENESIFSFFQKFFGEKACTGFIKFKNTFLSVLSSYLRAQLIIGGIIFLILIAGFLFLKVNYAFVLALITSLVDAVPVLGTGTVLIPMSVFYFLTKSTASGWGILILYGITLLARQICEPKILGKTFGIHPLLAIFSIYVGMKIFGVVGLILGPFVAIFIKILLFS